MTDAFKPPEQAEETGIDIRRCYPCGLTEDQIDLHKCPMCHHWYCDECEVVQNGKRFCSKHCSAYFFWGDEDD